MTETSSDERIAKYLARAGIASRREIERMIAAGRIKVNGKALDTPAFKVSATDRIEVDGKPVEAPAATRLWRYHKPDGLVTTHADPEGRETVFDALPADLGRVISIGRLDLTSEGLLLLTNDGALARALELPSTGWTRRYRARAFGTIDEAAVQTLRRGVTVEGLKYGPMEVEVERETGSNIWLNIGIKEGKNREVRRALDAVGLRVNRLIRTAYGPFQLGDLARGEVKPVPSRVLRDQCGHLVDLPVTTGEAVAKARPTRKPARRAMGGVGQPGLPKPKPEEADGPAAHKYVRGRSGAKAGARPGAKPGAKPGGRPGTKPGGKPATGRGGPGAPTSPKPRGAGTGPGPDAERNTAAPQKRARGRPVATRNPARGGASRPASPRKPRDGR